MAVTGPGLVANEAEKTRRGKYSCLTSTFCFVPVAVETMGALGEEAEELIYELGRRITEESGDG